MIPERARKTSLGAVISVSVESSASSTTRAARCSCGWSAATAGTDTRKTESNLRQLMDAHRRTCPLRKAQS